MRLATIGLGLIGCLLIVAAVHAETYSSSNYTSADPVVSLTGTFASSSHFQLFGSSGPIVIGESTSTNFIYRTGFLYFPLVTAPTVAATAGDSSVQLTWNAADTALGYSVSSYDIGTATASSGPFSYSDVGNVLSSNRTSLANGTTYYFVVRVKDFYTNIIATSSVVSATPVANNQNNNNNNSGGGGNTQNYATIVASGRTFPGALVYMIENGIVLATSVSDSSGNFNFLKSVAPGTGVFMFYAADGNGNRSGSVSYTAQLASGNTSRITDIVMPPLVTTDKSAVTPGDSVQIIGKSIPGATSVVTIIEIPGLQIRVVANTSGDFSTPLSTEKIGKGEYSLFARTNYQNTVSGQSELVKFLVGDETKVRPKTGECRIADFNCDGKVDLIDFSILIYWFDKQNPPAAIDLNADKKIDLIDFSILMYYWTGE